MFVPKTFVPDQPIQPTQAPQAQGSFVPKSFVPEQKSIGGFLNNVADSAGSAIGGIVSTIAHPFQTAKNLGSLALGAGELLIPGEQGNEQVARNVGSFYKQRYGGLSNIGNTLYNDPVGAALDASALLTGVGGLAKGVAGLATSGANEVSLASNAARIGRLGTGLSGVGAAIDPLTLPFRAVGGLTRKLSPALESASESVVTRGVGNPATQAKIAQRTGESAGSFMKRYDILDRSPETAGLAKKSILNQYDELAVNSGKKADISSVLNGINDEMARIETSPAKFSQANQNKLAELANRRQQIVQSFGLNNPNDPLLSQAAKYKTLDSFINDSNTINPTGTVFTKYNPESRAGLPIGENLQTLEKSVGGSPNDIVTIYRGTKGNKINPGDYITTNKQLAKDYAGTGKVVKMNVRKGDILDMVSEPGGEEYLYRPNASNSPRYTKKELTSLFSRSNTPKNYSVDVGKLTEFRRQAIEPDIPKSMFNLDARGSGTAQGTKFTRDMIRKAINATDPRLERLGMDYGVAKDIEKILTQAQTRGANRQLINFSKLGSAGVGGIVAGAPGASVGFLAEQIVNNPIFVKALSNLLGEGAKVTKTGLKAPNLFKRGYTGAKTFSRVQIGLPKSQNQ